MRIVLFLCAALLAAPAAAQTMPAFSTSAAYALYVDAGPGKPTIVSLGVLEQGRPDTLLRERLAMGPACVWAPGADLDIPRSLEGLIDSGYQPLGERQRPFRARAFALGFANTAALVIGDKGGAQLSDEERQCLITTVSNYALFRWPEIPAR